MDLELHMLLYDIHISSYINYRFLRAYYVLGHWTRHFIHECHSTSFSHDYTKIKYYYLHFYRSGEVPQDHTA